MKLGGVITGIITNSGTISAAGTGTSSIVIGAQTFSGIGSSAISIWNGASIGGITNNGSGLISNTSAGQSAISIGNGPAMLAANPGLPSTGGVVTGAITNSGTITSAGYSIRVNGTVTGGLIHS